MGSLFAPVKGAPGCLDAFPSTRSARVIVVRLSEGAGEMKAVFSRGRGEACRDRRGKGEKGAHPAHHSGEETDTPKPFPDGDPMPIEERAFLVEHLSFFSGALLTPGGAIYDPIWKITLGGKDR